jgi:chemotaxis protein CheD
MKEKDIRLYEYYLKPGYIFLNTEPSMISTVIASCVVVSLWDCRKKYGGMAHYLYPFTSSEDEATARYGNVAVSIRIISEDVGGDIGRKLVYNTFSNEVVVYKVKKLRRSDWYPYVEGGR